MTADHAHPPPFLPPVPLTLDGSAILHQMFRIRWSLWKAVPATEQQAVVEDAARVLTEMEGSDTSAVFSQLGHKGDLMLVHFRSSLDELNAVELRLAQLKLLEFLEPSTSYVSTVELGLYEASVRLYTALHEQGLQAYTPEWDEAVQAELERQRRAMAARIAPAIPARRYLCFYPMDKKRGEVHNWYHVPIIERQKMMREHGLVGRRYAGRVNQIISGSVGFDDWEWGVDLFADDPRVFKQLVYEMRFDEASAMYGLFGAFYLGLRIAAAELGGLLSGRLPAFTTGSS